MEELSRELEFLRELTDGELDRVLAITEYRAVEPGDVVVKQGGAVSSIFVLLEGGVRVSAVMSNDADAAPDEEVLVRLEPGELFGELSFITGEVPNLSVIAEMPSRLAAISKPRLYELIAEDASICRKLLFAFTRILVARLKNTGRELVLTRYFLRSS